MANRLPSMNHFPDPHEWARRYTKEELRDPHLSEQQLMLDYLLESDFVWEEAIKLIHLREHLYENAEMQQRIADDSRMHFARWLYEHGEMSE